MQTLGTSLIYQSVEANLLSVVHGGWIQKGQIMVIGVSTSEVIGEPIGTSGTTQIAKPIFEAIQHISEEFGFFVAYQCCEHLNRALVISTEMINAYGTLEQVSVIPINQAGGSMATYAYHHIDKPVIVETIQAHAGMDIGGTLIGMHLRRVAVPLRPPFRKIGQAHVTMAYTRPKLIGGARAVYTQESEVNQKHI